MPIFQAAIRDKRHRKEQGFSLIELLSVVIILGLVGVVVILSVPPARPGGEQAALQIAAKLNAAHDLSVMRGEVIGVSLQDGELQFLRYRTPQWRVIEDPRGSLKGLILSPGLSVEFELIAEAPKGVTGSADTDSLFTSREDEATSPDFLFLPTGDIPQFSILVRQGAKQWQVISNEYGTIIMQKSTGGRP
jgi:type II secretion system protein H